MQVIVRCLDLPEGKDLIWSAFNCCLPREGEGMIITDGLADQAVQVYEVVRVTHSLKVWAANKDGSFDSSTIWVTAKEKAVGRWSKV